MTRYASPPPELAQAIATAASRYGVPEATLIGIWRIESGSTFPNPFVNSSGYGGLFGTRNWNASTQAQADTAASILARLLREHGGDMAAALSAYSGGGYSSVGAGPATVAAPAAPRQRPGVGGAQEVSFIDPMLQLPVSALEKAWGAIVGGITGPWDVLKAFLWLAEPRTWLRIVEFLTGAALILLALRALVLVFVARETSVQFSTLGGAASLMRKRARPAFDTLVPGGRGRHRRRQARAKRRERTREERRRDREFGTVPF